MENQVPEPVWSVSDVNRAVKEMIETGFRPFWMSGEVGSLLLHRSGHAYFSLKDEKSQIRVCYFGGADELRRLGVANGSLVEIRGGLSVYEVRGEYQFNCRQIRLSGPGDLFRWFELLKRKLAEEGLFDAARKRPSPRMPGRIGVVTSPNGAAIRDFLNVVTRRFSGLEIKIFPARVQGEGTAESVASGVEFFNRTGIVDVIVVTRGGGSMEDLWGFNEEILARSIAASSIPVISAVGHEIDTTICDFVADLRVPTPSAAAELVVASRTELETHLVQLKKQLGHLIELAISRCRERLNRCAEKLRSPEKQLRSFTQHLDDLDIRMLQAISGKMHAGNLRLEQLSGKLSALDPLRQLKNGYVFVSDPENGKPVKSSLGIRSGTALRLAFADGKLDVVASSGKPGKKNAPPVREVQDELF